jgi:WD40 repeat protein/DNA-binding SARP family transcriptional activator
VLQIRLLGQFDVRLDGKRVAIATRVAQSLLAYLALTAGTSHRREKLAGLFWPNATEERARTYLRQELWWIRKAITSQESLSREDFLLAEPLTLTFNRNADYWLDVSLLERPDFDIESLTSSLSLYQGELLPGFYDDWVFLERERIQTVFESKMNQLVDKLVEAERWAAVQEHCERWLSMSSASEPGYRALMLSYSARGDIAKVNAIYRRCADELLDQFGAGPSAETQALYKSLSQGGPTPRRANSTQPSGMVTFLFTDIEGSTRLLEKLGEHYAATLADHHKILRAAIQKWNGREMDTQGDAFFVTFARALDAVQCAAEAQQMLASHSWPQGQPILVRMGLHTGEPLIASTGYVGMDVHRAARIGDAGHGGQILLSQSTRELVMHKLPEGIEIRELGEHRLKDMKFPSPIFQLVVEGQSAEFPPLRTKFTGMEAPIPGEPPFKGLQYFEEADCDLFFGRETLTAKFVKQLETSSFLSVIIGASGSGKSSLVRAGLIPSLKDNVGIADRRKSPGDSRTLEIHIITPTAHPLEALAVELTRQNESMAATATLMDDLTNDPRSLALFLASKDEKSHILLVVDQFEELFTLCRDEFERVAFIDNLLAAVSPSLTRNGDQRGITLILTLRADFYAHLAQYPELRALVAKHQEYIGPMTVDELRRAIEEPARRGHWDFEPGLVELILRDVGDEPGALPLLSHALLETWKGRIGHTLTLKGYADAGGVRGAIAHTAESVYSSLSAEEQAIARNLFLRLTELGEGTEDTRRRTSYVELMSTSEDEELIHAVLNKLADARLVTLGESTAEVAHEALIREWPTLREWLDQDREGLRLHRRLTEAAYEWELLERDAGGLYRGAPLAQAQEWAALHAQALNTGEQIFLDASIEEEQREQQEREDQQRRELAAARQLADTQKARAEEQAHAADRLQLRNRMLSGVGVVAFLLAIVAFVFSGQSNANAIKAQANLEIANQQRAAAVNAQATAIGESQIRATQQAVAEANFRQAEAQRLAAEANKLILSQGSPELIALLSIRSMNIEYTSQGDAALAAAARSNYPKQVFIPKPIAPIYALAFSPDSTYILICSQDHTAGIWDTKTGRETHKLSGHDAPILSAVFSPDGKHVLTGSSDTTARLWDAATGETVQKFIGHTRPLTSVAFSPDGTLVLTGSKDGTARLWDAATGKELRRLVNEADPIRSIAFSPNGKYALTGQDNGSLRLWDIQTGMEVRQFIGHKSSINSVSFSPDGNAILSGGNDMVARLWDVATGRELQSFRGHTNNVGSVAFSPDGRYIFTGSDDGTARKWDPKSGQELQRYTGVASRTEISSIDPDYMPTTSMPIAVSPDGNSLLTGSGSGETRLWSTEPATRLPIYQNTGIVNGLAFSPNGQNVLTGDSNGVVRLWDAKTGARLRDFSTDTDAINDGVAFSPDGRSILIGSSDATLRLWDIQTGKEIREFIGPATGIESTAFSPDGKHVLAGASDGVWLWTTDTGHEVWQQDQLVNVIQVSFSSDGKYMIATEGGDSSSYARVWDVLTGHLISYTGYSTLALRSVALSPNGKYILTAGLDRAAQLWDLQSHKQIRQFVGHTDTIQAAIFSPDGKLISTASADGTARLWDTQTGQEIRRLIGHAGAVENVAFSPDGKYILTASDDGTAMLWDVDYHTTAQYLCSRLWRDFTTRERNQFNIQDKEPTCPKQ